MAITRLSNRRDWSRMPYELLCYIFSLMNALDRITKASAVCRSWRLACSDERLTRTLDIAEFRRLLKPKTPKRIAKRQLEFVFVRGINLCRLNLATLAFDSSFQVTNKHLRYAYRRCPNLKNLVLPFSESTREACQSRAFQKWQNLESLHIINHDIYPPYKLLGNVHSNCSRLGVLKISCRSFNPVFLKHLALYTPTLKVLCIRCVFFDASGLADELSRTKVIEEMYFSVISIQSMESLTKLYEAIPAVNDTRNRQGFPVIRAFHGCNWIGCGDSCLASTMCDPPVHIPEILAAVVGPN